MIVATGTGVLLFTQIDPSHTGASAQVRLAMTVWIVIRSTFGVLRVWPRLETAVLRLSESH